MSDSVLPKGWFNVRLGELLEFKYGKSLPAKARDGEGSPVYGSNGVVGMHSEPIVNAKGLIIGRKGSFGEVHISQVPYSPIDTTYFVDEFYGMPIKYWYYQLKKLPLTQLNRSTAIPGLNRDDAYGQKINLPPLGEQKQIATKLDELLAQVDTIKTRLDAIPTILKRFRQSVLAAAVSGKLTEDFRMENTEMKNIYPDDYFDEKLGGVDLDEKYCLIPEKWGWVRFGSQVRLINGDRGKNYPNKAEYVDKGLPFINTGHIKPDGSLSLKKMNYISREKFDSLGGGKIQENDLVYCLRGATMGKTAIVNPLTEGAIASSLVIARPKLTVLTEFSYIFLTSPQGKDLILRFDNGTAQPNLSAKSLALFPLGLPPLQEQTEIVRRVDQLFEFTDQIEKQVNAAQTRVNNLTQSILAKAFRGDLTAEWREQNPDLISGENSAESLLEKIKAEREKLQKKKPKKKAARKKKMTA